MTSPKLPPPGFVSVLRCDYDLCKRVGVPTHRTQGLERNFYAPAWAAFVCACQVHDADAVRCLLVMHGSSEMQRAFDTLVQLDTSDEALAAWLDMMVLRAA